MSAMCSGKGLLPGDFCPARICSSERCGRSVSDTHLPNRQVIYDPINTVRDGESVDQEAMMNEAFELLGDDIAAIHIKDFVIEDGKIVPAEMGKGIFRFDILMQWLKARKPLIHVLMEEDVYKRQVPDTFKLELYTEFADENGEYALDDEYFYQDYLELTDADKEKLLYVSAEIDKSAVRVATKTVEINKPFEANNCVIDRVLFSPFGNQLMLTTSGNEPSDIYRVDHFALRDENGKFLDVLNTDLAFYTDRESSNSFEFLKADADTEQMRCV